MENTGKIQTRTEIEKARQRLDVLEEIDLLESEFRLIQHEYNQRRETLEKRLTELTA